MAMLKGFHGEQNIKVIIGANYGDEGKGQMTDYFASEAYSRGEDCLVVLSNGGSQRGHTVVLPSGKKHVFSHFGSGTYVWAKTYMPADYILNPMNFYKEYIELASQGVQIGTLFINKDCRVSTPFDMIANQVIEEWRGNRKHGSCGMGIWETVLRDGLRAGELYLKLADGSVKQYLEFVRDDYFSNRFSQKGIKPNKKWTDIIYNESLINHFIYDLQFIFRNTSIVSDKVISRFKNVIFENGQGLLLDQNNFGIHTTPSNTGLQNARKIMDCLQNNKNVEVCYVTRTYLTRHGAGELPAECKKDRIDNNIKYDSTNRFNIHQGHLRYGVMDWADLEKRALDDFNKYSDDGWEMSFGITHINEHNEIPESILENYEVYLSDGPTRKDIRKGAYNGSQNIILDCGIQLDTASALLDTTTTAV